VHKFLGFLIALLLVPGLCFGSASRDYDGTDDRLTTTSSVLAPKGQAKTIVTWVNPDIVDVTKYYLSINDASAVRALIFATVKSIGTDDCLQFQISDSTQTAGNFLIRKSSADLVIVDRWNPIAVTHTGTFTDLTTVHLYYNLSETGYYATSNQNGVGIEATESGTWSIGGRTSDNTVNFNGKIAYFQYYDSVLSLPFISEVTYKPEALPSAWNVPNWGSSPEMDLGAYNKKPTVVNGTTTSTSGPPVMFGGGLPL